MTSTPIIEITHDIPTKIFVEFLQAIENVGMSVELVTGLRKVLMEDKIFTERALKEAILPEVPLS